MSLSDDLERIAASAQARAASGETIAGILPTQPLGAGRVYLCAFESGDGRSWLALDDDGAPVPDRMTVRDAASIAVLCEVAEESAGGGDLEELIARIVELREREAPEGIDEAEAAARALAAELAPAPRLATPDYLDRIGAASRLLEQTLGDDPGSPFAAAMQQALPAVEELTAEIERTYRGPLA